jgi:hypothetical protein
MGEPPPSPPQHSREYISSKITPIEQTFYLVTEQTLQDYAHAGYLSNLFLTIFGVCTGGFLSCWVAQATSALSQEVLAAVSTAKYGLLAFGLIFLALSLVFLWRGRQLRLSILKLPPPGLPLRSK